MNHHRRRRRGRPVGAKQLRGTLMRVNRLDAERLSRAASASAIRRIRLEQGVSCAELARACGVSAATVHAWEARLIGIPLGRLRQVAIALGVPVDHLIG